MGWFSDSRGLSDALFGLSQRAAECLREVQAAAQLACHRVLELRPAEAAAIVWVRLPKFRSCDCRCNSIWQAIAGKSRPGAKRCRLDDIQDVRNLFVEGFHASLAV